MKNVIVILFACSTFHLYAQIWKPYGLGFSPNGVLDLVNLNNELYACGGIVNSGTTIVNGIARWDGVNWNSLGNGANFGGPNSMTIFNNDLIGGGFFLSMGGVSNTKSIAKWDGSNWYAMAKGVTSGTVNTMAPYNGNLYIGGDFDGVDSMLIRDISSWWNKFKIPFLIIIIIVLWFIFYTQQETFSRMIAYIASFTAGVPVILRVFTLFSGIKGAKAGLGN